METALRALHLWGQLSKALTTMRTTATTMEMVTMLALIQEQMLSVFVLPSTKSAPGLNRIASQTSYQLHIRFGDFLQPQLHMPTPCV